MGGQPRTEGERDRLGNRGLGDGSIRDRRAKKSENNDEDVIDHLGRGRRGAILE